MAKKHPHNNRWRPNPPQHDDPKPEPLAPVPLLEKTSMALLNRFGPLKRLKLQRWANARVKQLKAEGKSDEDIISIVQDEASTGAAATATGLNPNEVKADWSTILDALLKILELIFSLFGDESAEQPPAE